MALKLFRHGRPWMLMRSVWGVCCLLGVGCGREEIRVYEVSKEQAPPAASPSVAGGPVSIPSLRWESLPAGWKDLQVSSRTRAASFSIEAGNEQGEVSVIALPGMGENDLEFVNMWRKQIQLGEVRAEELPKYRTTVPIAGQDGKMFDMKGGEEPSATETNGVLVAMTVKDGVSFFFKLSGSQALVRGQRPLFEGFLKGVSFAPAASLREESGSALAETASPGRPEWEIPAGWQESAPGPMVLAKFTAQGEAGQVDVTVSSFPGDVGGLLANVNRWRGQVGLSPWDPASLQQHTQVVEAGDGKATVVDFSGKDSKTGKDSRLVGAVVPRGGETWFYKMLGDPAAAEGEKSRFITFIRSAKHSHAN